jgi:hypothetical protein
MGGDVWNTWKGCGRFRGVLGRVAAKDRKEPTQSRSKLAAKQPPPAIEGAHFGSPLARTKGDSATRVAETGGWVDLAREKRKRAGATAPALNTVHLNPI